MLSVVVAKTESGTKLRCTIGKQLKADALENSSSKGTAKKLPCNFVRVVSSIKKFDIILPSKTCRLNRSKCLKYLKYLKI